MMGEQNTFAIGIRNATPFAVLIWLALAWVVMG